MSAQAAGGLWQRSSLVLSASSGRVWRASRAFHLPKRCISAASTPGGDSIDVQRLAELSQIEVTPEEAEEWGPKIAGIVDWFGQLQNVNTDGVEPSLRALTDEANVLRPDTLKEFENREGLMNEVPEMEGPFVRVPKVM